MRNVISIRAIAVPVLLAATVLVARADDKGAVVELKNFKFKVDEAVATLFGLNEDEGKLFFYTNGKAEAAIKVDAEGEYEIVLKASCNKALDEFAKFKLSLDGELIGKETALTSEEEKEYKLTAKCKAGNHKLAIEFTNDTYKENEYDRNLYVHAVTLKKK